MEADSPRFEIEDMTISAGETFDVPVLLKNNPGIAGFGLDITYDQSKLELTGRKANMTVTLGQNITDCPYPISFGVTENYTEADSIVATLTFKAKDDFPSGATPITVSMRRGGEPFDEMDEFVPGFEYVSGTIQIPGPTPEPTPEPTPTPKPTPTPTPAPVDEEQEESFVLSLSFMEEGVSVRLSGTAPENAVMVVAYYHANGRMLSSQFISGLSAAQLSAGYTVPNTLPDAVLVQAFLLNGTEGFSPLCAAEKLVLEPVS